MQPIQPTDFRAYAKIEALSRRDTSEGKMNLSHDVHDPVAEGKVSDGIAGFSSKTEIAYVAFYAGEGDEQVCLGRLDGPFAPGKISANFADIQDEPPLAAEANQVVVDGVSYRKAE